MSHQNKPAVAQQPTRCSPLLASVASRSMHAASVMTIKGHFTSETCTKQALPHQINLSMKAA
ncbi:hypothetical protein MGSAQ_000193 [marine sediment metagenome]|uniref:Uncharacterized protein n=1 Tax=marine sediment metagenome TaxID=412755 RepID=A0A1B6NYS5_9ZZZZ